MLATSILIVSILTGISAKAAEDRPSSYFVQIGVFENPINFEKICLD